MSKLQGVPDTLYIPLAARIYMSERFPEYFYDEKVLSLKAEFPDSSIQKKSSEYTQIASAARYYNVDKMVENFLKQHPDFTLKTEKQLYPSLEHDGAYAALLVRK